MTASARSFSAMQCQVFELFLLASAWPNGKLLLRPLLLLLLPLFPG
jgi:hypothetical protein